MNNGLVSLIKDMPVVAKLTGKGRTINAAEVFRIIQENLPDIAYVEKVHAMPKQGSSSTFEFGYGVGVLHGVLASLKIPMKLVTPQAWKKHSGLIRKEKDAARSLAITQHPEAASQLNLKKHGGRADSICIGDYAWSQEK